MYWCTYPGGFEWNSGKNWIKAASSLSRRGHSIRTAGLSLLFVVKSVLHVFTLSLENVHLYFLDLVTLDATQIFLCRKDSKLHMSFTQLAPCCINQPRWLLPLAYLGLREDQSMFKILLMPINWQNTIQKTPKDCCLHTS